MIPNAVIHEIRARVDPVEVIGRRIELKKSGTSFSAACPFHADHTPSFRVFPDSKRFKCFGCGVRGDVFEFLRRFEGKDFRTVVRELSGEVGVTIPENGAPARQPVDGSRLRLERACEAALAHWSEHLWGEAGAEARHYLAARGIDEATARMYRLGWAPHEWHDLQVALRGRGFEQEDLLRAGLIRESGKAHPATYDHFRGRVIFPFARPGGRLAGFGGRDVPAKGQSTTGPKYVNSPETTLFHKGQLLFGLAEAQAAIRSARRAVLVEGYFDALMLHQVGLHEVVALAGTAVTEHQLALLQRCGCEELLVLFDADDAGLEAPALVAPVLLRGPLSTRVGRLPRSGGTDPDTFVRAQGAPALQPVLDSAVPLTEWLLERAIVARTARTGTKSISVEQKLLIVRDLSPYVAAARAGLTRALFEQRIARRLELYIVALRAEIARANGRHVHESREGGEPCPA